MSENVISNYLTHWTGSNLKSDEEAYAALESIIGTRELWLSKNRQVEKQKEGCSCEYTLNMACFTDIPLRFSARHCHNYGKVGISFHKQKRLGREWSFRYSSSHRQG